MRLTLVRKKQKKRKGGFSFSFRFLGWEWFLDVKTMCQTNGCEAGTCLG
jgi:hypothetical protein